MKLYKAAHHKQNPHRAGFTAGFTLLELLTVFGILAALAALLFPVFAQVRAKARQNVCASNLRQIGTALLAYMQDHDETIPNGRSADTVFPNHRTYPMNAGWAGRLFPYVKDAALFHCPEDTTAGNPVKKSVPVSYGINQNMAQSPQAATWTAAAQTVFLFEVENNKARVSLPDEGIGTGLAYPETTSAAGMGIDIWDLGTITPPDNAPDKGYVTRFATGYIDNHDDPDVPQEWRFSAKGGRHHAGANYLAADGHMVWQTGAHISAGHTGSVPTQVQSHTGCKNIGGFGGFPCAEGTAVGKHILTFSTK